MSTKFGKICWHARKEVEKNIYNLGKDFPNGKPPIIGCGTFEDDSVITLEIYHNHILLTIISTSPNTIYSPSYYLHIKTQDQLRAWITAYFLSQLTTIEQFEETGFCKYL